MDAGPARQGSNGTAFPVSGDSSSTALECSVDCGILSSAQGMQLLTATFIEEVLFLTGHSHAPLSELRENAKATFSTIAGNNYQAKKRVAREKKFIEQVDDTIASIDEILNALEKNGSYLSEVSIAFGASLTCPRLKFSLNIPHHPVGSGAADERSTTMSCRRLRRSLVEVGSPFLHIPCSAFVILRMSIANMVGADLPDSLTSLTGGQSPLKFQRHLRCVHKRCVSVAVDVSNPCLENRVQGPAVPADDGDQLEAFVELFAVSKVGLRGLAT
jgi:hypothetical protein